MEKELRIKSRDGLEIRGILYNKDKSPSRLLIFVHGMSACPKASYLPFRTTEFFFEKGFAVYSYNEYSDDEVSDTHPRALYGGITLQRQIEDLQDVFALFQNQYKEIFLIGHSYGGTTVVGANLPAKAQCLFDPTFAGHFEKADNFFEENGNYVFSSCGQKVLINEKIYDENSKLTFEEAAKRTQNLISPTKVISAKKGSFWRNKYYQEFLPQNGDFEVMDANHVFSKIHQVDEACSKAYEWFENCKKNR